MTEVRDGLRVADRRAIETVEAVILDVGHGNCAVLRDGDRCVIVDAKSDKLLYRELIASGVRRIEHLVLSHADSDHIAGALRLLPNEDFEIGTVWLNADSDKDSLKWHELLVLLSQLTRGGRLKTRLGICDQQDWELSLDRVMIDVLHPALIDIGHGTGRAGKIRPEMTTNGMSVVLRVLMDGIPALLLPGDLDAAGLEQVIGRSKDATAHVLVYPHHGGHSGAGSERDFAKQLCEVVDPSVVVFSMGRGSFHNPLREVVEQIGVSRPEARVACTQLSPNCHAGDVPAVQPPHLLDRPSAGAVSSRCCAGSLRIAVRESALAVSPTPEDHAAWIEGHVDAPMCNPRVWLPQPRKA
ncbi:ComEC/Rec2 family competence protein [Streptomyces purpureus]|uniref:ComEC/Rec2 family competence protein n=1 Tax=Streptomyces purpureus TaxID=1951 RepID=UPI0037BDCCFD